MQYGLLGRRLSHSYSPQIHNLLGNYDYSLYEVEPDELSKFFSEMPFDGINVTIPYKKDVITFCDELSPCAQKLGAVNTIVRKPGGTLVGHNTDYFGFKAMVARSGLSVAGKKVLVLGSGGASATAVAVLQELSAFPVVISRTGENNYENLHLHKDAAVIVNTTPVGMSPNVNDSPIDLGNFPALEGVLDVIYNPAHTKLLTQAEELGFVAENGLWMLVAQAKESAEWFTRKAIDDTMIEAIHNKLCSEMKNIVLIGMPGCGKSTISRILAEKLGKTFIDTDIEIISEAGMPIQQIFDQFGEDGFRQIESKVLAKIGAISGHIIATGGGCITRSENYDHLHRNGTIVWLKRDIHLLPTAGRPLSKNGDLHQMYAIRKPLYETFADIIVENDQTPDEVANTIISRIMEG